jgi:hypothetical protein
LEDHVYTKVEELEKEGVPREDAIFQAIDTQGRPDVVGYGLRKFRWIDVRSKGTARGFIAVGPRAVGVFAFGGVTMGVFAFGGVSLGVFGMGGLVLSLLLGWGGCVVSLFSAYGGVALGALAFGGLAVGIYVTGGTALGLYAKGASGTTWSLYSFDAAPDWIQSMFKTIMNGSFFATMSIILVVVWFVIFGFMMYMMNKERRRIYRADPQLLDF